jgi:hypothetical protein
LRTQIWHACSQSPSRLSFDLTGYPNPQLSDFLVFATSGCLAHSCVRTCIIRPWCLAQHMFVLASYSMAYEFPGVPSVNWSPCRCHTLLQAQGYTFIASIKQVRKTAMSILPGTCTMNSVTLCSMMKRNLEQEGFVILLSF